jgi:hypothetical protein
MDELHMVREGSHLVPVDEMSAEELARLPLRTQVLVKVTQPRNLPQHRLAWALATKVAEACDWLHDREDAMDWLKIKARHVRYIHDHHNGETTIVPKSIRFAALDQQGFDRVFKRMVFVTVSEIIPGLDEDALRAEIESMVGIDQAPGDPAPAKPPRQHRTMAAMPDPVSIIPPADEPPPASDFPGDRPLPESPVPMAHQPVPSATPAPSSPAAQNAAAQAPVSTPKNFAEWAPWCRAWMATMEADPEKTDQDAMLRWNGERNIRNDCGVSSHERAPIFAEYSDMLDRMRARRR